MVGSRIWAQAAAWPFDPPGGGSGCPCVAAPTARGPRAPVAESARRSARAKGGRSGWASL